MVLTLDDLFCDHVAGAVAKQQALAAFLGNSPGAWQMDVRAGTLTLSSGNGQRHTFTVQLLGSQSDEDQSWLWAWANAHIYPAARSLVAARALRALGERDGISELSEGLVPLRDSNQGLHMVMAASGICDAACYYIGGYEGGSAYMLVDDPRFPRLMVQSPLQRVVFDFPQLLTQLSIPDHRRAFLGMLRFYGLTMQEEGAGVTGIASDGAAVQAHFDALNRLASLESTLQNPAATTDQMSGQPDQPQGQRRFLPWNRRRPS